MTHINDVASRTGPDACAKCRKPLARHDRLTEVKIVAGVGPHPGGSGECLYVSEFEEYAHVHCENRGLSDPFIEIPRSTLRVESDLDQLEARVPDYICCRCRKRFKRSDRVVPVILVEGLGRDPNTGGKGLQCSPEYEMVHYDCRDPQLGDAS